ncbi:MAG: sugar phosphate isomerase/epimerase family protein [Dehalococcoidia bacterium]
MPFSGIGINETPDVAPAALEARLQTLVDLGYDAVEVRLHHAGAPAGSEPVLFGGRLNRLRVQELAASLDRFPLRRTLHASTIFPSDPALRAVGVEVADAMVELGESLDAEVLVVHPGSPGPDATPEVMVGEIARERQVVGSMAWWAADFGARIAIENMIGLRSFASDPDALAEQVERLLDEGHDNLGICLDVGHLALSATARGFDFVTALRRLAPLVVHTHMSDNFGKPVSTAGYSPLEQMRFGIGDLHLPIGWGTIPLEDAFGGADFSRGPIFLYELNQALRGSLADGVESGMVTKARHLIEVNAMNWSAKSTVAS